MDTILSAEQVISGQNRLAFPRGHGDFLYWMERLADEENRWVVRRRNINTQDDYETLTPAGFTLASKVHEYGGIAYGVGDEGLVWINKSDQAVYHSFENTHQKLYQHPDWRFGEPLVCKQGVILIAEKKSSVGFPKNMLVFINWNSEVKILHSGADFYAAPALSPDKTQLLWMTWDMPAMPWQQSCLWGADFQADGTIQNAQRLFDQPNVAVFQPDFTPEGEITFVQDSSGFGCITLPEQEQEARSGSTATGKQKTITQENCEYGLPLWQLGMRTYTATGKQQQFIAARAKNGVWELVRQDPNQELIFCLDDAHVSDPVAVGKGFAALVAPQDGAQQIGYWPDANSEHTIVLHKAADCHEAPWAVTPESLWFQGASGTVQGYFYCPKARDTLPPVIIKCHGGPSGQTDPALNLKHQFWLSRGLAIFDINYSGSTGFGREYLSRLEGQWGALDSADCIAGLEFLIKTKRVDPRKAFISGSSAGGLTVLNCLCHSDLFAGGVCAYGVADLESLVAITHKFEARYLDGLVGTLPEAKAVYQARSPLYKAGKIRAPMLFLQGKEDCVVPPEQTQTMIRAILDQPDAPEVTALYFDDEGHGFSNPDNLLRALQLEAEFYGEILSERI